MWGGICIKHLSLTHHSRRALALLATVTSAYRLPVRLRPGATGRSARFCDTDRSSRGCEDRGRPGSGRRSARRHARRSRTRAHARDRQRPPVEPVRSVTPGDAQTPLASARPSRRARSTILAAPRRPVPRPTLPRERSATRPRSAPLARAPRRAAHGVSVPASHARMLRKGAAAQPETAAPRSAGDARPYRRRSGPG